MRTWIAQPPTVEGKFGTGPVDLLVATNALNGPPGFDIPGGSGNLFNRAQMWFAEAANSATSDAERHETIVGVVSALNNLAVWCMIKFDAPDRDQRAMEALERAESIARSHLEGTEFHAGILFNLEGLMQETGHPDKAAVFLGEAARLGVQ